MVTPSEPQDTRPVKMRKGTGEIDPPAGVQAFLTTSNDQMGEADYLKVGRPLWMVRYTVVAPGGGLRYAYVCTMIPACEPLVAATVCPWNTCRVEAGYAVGGNESWSPVEYREYPTEDAARSAAEKAAGRPQRAYYWTHDQNPWMLQRYSVPDTGDASAEPQYAAGPVARPEMASKPKRSPRRKSVKDVPLEVEVNRMIAEGSPDVPTSDHPTTAEDAHEAGKTQTSVHPSMDGSGEG